MSIKLLQGDITKLKVDAIVNAANNSLLGGGGVDGAIHAAAGPELLEECRQLNGCETGEAKSTKAYQLPSKFVIHTVGPIWKGGNSREHELLASSYRESLSLALQLNCKSIACPNISTGVYGFPKKEAARIALEEVHRFIKAHPSSIKIYFISFDQTNFQIYSQMIEHFRH